MQRATAASMTAGGVPATSGNTLSNRRNDRRAPSLAMHRLPRFVELLLVVALCALIALWATRVMRGTAIPVPPQAGGAGATMPSRVDAAMASARLFGSRPPGVLSDNVRAIGVVADSSGRGSVIVSVDGQPPKVYRVGDTLDGRLVSAIRPEEIELESGGARQVFRLPPRVAASGVTVLGTGTAPVIGPNATLNVVPPMPPLMPPQSFQPTAPPQSYQAPAQVMDRNGVPMQRDPRRQGQIRGDAAVPGNDR
jgi:general secretion pathway protein C